MSTPDLSLATHHRRYFESTVASAATRFRDLADEIERHAARGLEHVPSLPPPTYGDIAARITHTVAWGIANAHIDGIVSAAATADRDLAADRFIADADPTT